MGCWRETNSTRLRDIGWCQRHCGSDSDHRRIDLSGWVMKKESGHLDSCLGVIDRILDVFCDYSREEIATHKENNTHHRGPDKCQFQPRKLHSQWSNGPCKHGSGSLNSYRSRLLLCCDSNPDHASRLQSLLLERGRHNAKREASAIREKGQDMTQRAGQARSDQRSRHD